MPRVFPSYFGTPGYESNAFRSWPLPKYFEDNLGIQWATPESADEVWLFDFSWSGLRKALKVPRSHRKLFVFEPQAVNPIQHTLKIQSMFGQVFVFSRAQVKPTNTFVEGEGYRGVSNRLSKPKEVPRIGAAFGNKQSVVPGSLYWLRVDAMVALLNEGYEVTLAGPGWEDSSAQFFRQLARTLFDCSVSMKLPNLALLRPRPLKRLRKFEKFHYAGWVDDEVEFFRNFDELLIIENDEFFLSEKPFGAIFSGVPFVYVGPSEFVSYAPRERVAFANSASTSIVKSIKNQERLKPKESLSMRSIQRRSSQDFYLRLSSEIQSWSAPHPLGRSQKST
jgi:hypothetical protein